jgi:hypothetical protein
VVRVDVSNDSLTGGALGGARWPHPLGEGGALALVERVSPLAWRPCGGGCDALQDIRGAQRRAVVVSEVMVVVEGVACGGGVILAGVGRCCCYGADVEPGVLLLSFSGFVVVVVVVTRQVNVCAWS